MRIGIIDADLLDHGTRHPNLALMKISGYLKDHDHDVSLLLAGDMANMSSYRDLVEQYDKIIVSKVFDFSKIPQVLTDAMLDNRIMRQGTSDCKDYDHMRGRPKIVFGGTGFIPLLNGAMPNALPNAIEHQQRPDYHLYDKYVESEIAAGKVEKHYDDYRYYSIGFTTRGCFRRCKFCVNREYRGVFVHSPITEFYDSSRPYIYLWDDNFLALKDHAVELEGDPYFGYTNTWRGILDDLDATGKPFQFRQGLDMRLMDDEIAERFTTCRYHGDFIFAFDHISDKQLIVRKLKVWRKYNPVRIPKFYVLCGFDNQDVRDVVSTLERIRVLMQFGCLPYIMRHSDYKKSKYSGLYTHLARWCNQPQFLKKKSFRAFCEANQFYHEQNAHRNPECSTMQAMRLFEQDYPEVAKLYFDLRWEDLRDDWKVEYKEV